MLFRSGGTQLLVHHVGPYKNGCEDYADTSVLYLEKACVGCKCISLILNFKNVILHPREMFLICRLECADSIDLQFLCATVRNGSTMTLNMEAAKH